MMLAVLSIVLLLGPPEVVADDEAVLGQADDHELVTSRSGSLQRRLAEAFPEAFIEGVDIVWEPHDGWVSPEVLAWWSRQIAEEDLSGISRTAAESMFAQIDRQDPMFSMLDRRKICAVVGASRNLLGSQYGNLIDAHKVVFRINRAPTEAFEEDVGERATHHVMWPRSLEPGQYDPEAFLLISPVTANNPGVLEQIVTLARHELGWDLERVRIIHPEFVRYVHQRWTGTRGSYPSTGFITLMLALHVCDEVDVFGFGADADGRWDRYYEDVIEDPRPFHPVDVEGEIRNKLEESGLIKVYRGSRP